MSKTILKIQGMHCGSCAVSIEKALKKESGIASVSVNFASEKVNIEFNKKIIKLEKIREIIKKLDYETEEEKYDLNAKESHDHNKRTNNREINKLRNTFIISAALGLPIFYLVMGEMMGFPLPELSMKAKPSCSTPCIIRSVRCFTSPAKLLATNVAPASIINDIGLNGSS